MLKAMIGNMNKKGGVLEDKTLLFLLFVATTLVIVGIIIFVIWPKLTGTTPPWGAR